MRNAKQLVSSERRAAVLEAMDKLNTKFSHAVVTHGVSGRKYEVVPTGVAPLDRLLGIKGYPRGLVTEIFGPEQTHKTTLALKSVAAVQAAGGQVAFIDCSHSLEKRLTKNIGVNTETLFYVKPLSPDEAWSAAEALLETKALDLVVVDGFGALRAQAMKKTEHAQSKTSLLAVVIKNLGIWAAQSNTAVVITRRMNPNLSYMAAAEEVIRKTAQVRLEMINHQDDHLRSIVKLHKNIPGGHSQEDAPVLLDVTW